MARYIDADALKERLEDFSKWCKDGRKQGVDFVLDCPLPDMPTADVAPRAEVAREIFDEIENLLSANMSGELRCDSIEWFDYFDLHLAEDIAELKKKYTEEKK